jgi:hypothetical protein
MRFCSCGRPLGPRAEMCRRCWKRADRRWKAGLLASAHPHGGRRGRLPLGTPTAKEARAAEQLLAIVSAYRRGREEILERVRPLLEERLAELDAANPRRRNPP